MPRRILCGSPAGRALLVVATLHSTIALGSVGSQGESTIGSAESSASERATVVVYYRQPHDLFGGAWPATQLIVDGQTIAKLPRNSVVRLSVAPGRHAFWPKKPEDKIELELRAGRTYHLRVAWIPKAVGSYPRFDAVCPEVGVAEAALQRLQPLNSIRRSETIELAASPPADGPQTAEGEALVTVYRPVREAAALLEGAWVNASVHVDGAEHGELQAGTYLQLRVPAGARNFYADEPKDTFELIAEPAGQYFMRVDLVMGGFKSHGRIRVVPVVQALAELQGSMSYPRAYPRRPPVVPAADVSLPPMPGAAAAPGAEGSAALAVVYYPREDASGRRTGGATVVSVDGAEVTKMAEGTFVSLELEPGLHRFTAGSRGKRQWSFELDLAPGQQQFLRVEGDGPFFPVCEEQGSSEIQGRMKDMGTKKL